MFKSLLRTLPSLSGNMQLCCILNNEYKKIHRTSFQSPLKGYLIPLHNDYYNNKIEVNLKEDYHEWIIKKFYNLYYNIFYDFTYDDSKKLSDNINRNIYFEYGCNRYFKKIINKKFVFFAPIYIDNVNDIPTHFLIDITYSKNDKYLHKYINIDLKQSTDSRSNYLGDYLYKYISKINSKCIYINNESKGAIYEGIDLLNGGFCTKKYLGLKKFINTHYLINDFDLMINKGYESNCIINKQIIPLSFAFDLSDYDIIDYDVVNIKGNYYNGNILIGLEDFDIKYNTDMFNITNVQFPSLGENYLEKNKENNKINIVNNKWKLYESSDNIPYIINNNNAYSDKTSHRYKYNNTNISERLKHINFKDLCLDYIDGDNIYHEVNFNFTDNVKDKLTITDIIKNTNININDFKKSYSVQISNINNENKFQILLCIKYSKYEIIYQLNKEILNDSIYDFLNKDNPKSLTYHINKYKTIKVKPYINAISYCTKVNIDFNNNVLIVNYQNENINIEFKFKYDATNNDEIYSQVLNITQKLIYSNFIKKSICQFCGGKLPVFNLLKGKMIYTYIYDSNNMILTNNVLNIQALYRYKYSDNIYCDITIKLTEYENINKTETSYITLENFKNKYIKKNLLHFKYNTYNNSYISNHLKYDWYNTSINKEIYIDDLFIVQVPNAKYFNIFICENDICNDYVSHIQETILNYNNQEEIYEYYIIYKNNIQNDDKLYPLLQQKIDYIINQSNNYLEIIYKSTFNSNNNTWELKKLKNKMYFYLQRYFRNIIPNFVNSNTIKLYYRDDNNELKNINVNIYSQNKESILNNFIEYKFFNESKFVNIPDKIILECPDNFTEEYISYYEDKSYVMKIFTKYINQKINGLSNNEVIYIFNLYQYFFDILKITNNKYSLKYKFLIK